MTRHARVRRVMAPDDRPGARRPARVNPLARRRTIDRAPARTVRFGARTGCYVRGCGVTAARLLENVNSPGTTTHIDTVPVVVEEKVVGVSQKRHEAAGVR